MTWESIGGVNLNPSGAKMIEFIAGIAVKKDTTELMTIVTKSSINEDGIQDNNDLFILDNDEQILIGVH